MALTLSTTTEARTHVDVVSVPHPGEILLLEFLKPCGITQYRLANDIGTTRSQVCKITRGALGISADMALRWSAYFGNSAEFWLGLKRNTICGKLARPLMSAPSFRGITKKKPSLIHRNS
ncbi:HigA family addiction module antitoxin [Corynebacterium accolens]|uniref:HigA family addiction module antitoxin n=1 Tax=Corynebacterium accolens TaxID=38284 RepID=UPI00345EB068